MLMIEDNDYHDDDDDHLVGVFFLSRSTLQTSPSLSSPRFELNYHKIYRLNL